MTNIHSILEPPAPKPEEGFKGPLEKSQCNEPIKVILLAEPCKINHLCELLIAVVRSSPEGVHTMVESHLCSYSPMPKGG